MSEGIEWINKKLIDEYSRDVSIGLPNYRLVWSSSQYETRYVEGPIFSENGDIYLREEKGIKEIEKYPLNPNMWVLEKLQPNLANPELIENRYSYEPLWIFGVGNSCSQPIWKAVSLLIKMHLYMRIKLTQSDVDEEAERKFQAEKKLCKEILQNDVPALAFSLKHGCSVVVP